MLRQWHLSPSFTSVVSAPFLSSPPASCSSIPPKLVGLTCFCPFCISPSLDLLGGVSLLEDAQASSRPLCFVPAHPVLPLCSLVWRLPAASAVLHPAPETSVLLPEISLAGGCDGTEDSWGNPQHVLTPIVDGEPPTKAIRSRFLAV